MTFSEESIVEICREIQKRRPVIHCITNIVTVNDCANILLAAGASPTMAHHPKEAKEITAGSAALVCNLGATESFDAMLLAGAEAHRLGHPVVLDPVGVSGSSFRREFCEDFIKNIHPSCIRGNYSEIRALIEHRNTAAGVDARGGALDAEAVKQFAAETGSIVIASGAQDIVTDGENVYLCNCGSPLLSRVTGTGCMSSALLGAFLSVKNSFESAAACVSLIGQAGERAAEKTKQVHGGTMTFREYFIDEFSLL